MKILVIEDKEMHQESARISLAGHELTIVSSFDAAMEIMEPKINEARVKELLVEAGFSVDMDFKDRDRGTAYHEAYDRAREKSIIPFPFDVVLTDMMMPMSSKTLAREAFNPREQVPYGFVIALKAALCGAKFVAMVTDTNHHKGAMSAALDRLGSTYYREGMKPNFVINGAKCMFIHTPFLREVLGKAKCYDCGGTGVCKLCHGTGKRDDEYVKGECNVCTKFPGRCVYCKGTGVVDETRQDRKDWGKVFLDLTS